MLSRVAYLIFFIYLSIFCYHTIFLYVKNYRGSDGYVLQNGQVLGGDFRCFYVAGKMAASEPDSLYDFESQQNEQLQVISGRKEALGGCLLPYVYPPLVAYFFSFLSSLSFDKALFAWSLCSVVLFTLSSFLLISRLSLSLRQKLLLFVCTCAFEPFCIECLGGGQTSALGILIFSLVFILMKKEADFLAGLVLSLGYYKPPLFLFFSIFILVNRFWKVVCGALLGGLVLTLSTVAFVGVDGFLGYISQVSNYTYGSCLTGNVSLPVDQGVGLYAPFFSLVSSILSISATRIIYACLCLGVVLWISNIETGWRRRDCDLFDIVFAIGVILSLFLSLQAIDYDLSILIVPFLIVFDIVFFRSWDLAKILCIFSVLGFYTAWLFDKISMFDGCLKSTVIFFVIAVMGLVLLVRKSPNFSSLAKEQYEHK